MRLDVKRMFSDEQAITAAAVSDEVLRVGPDLGCGNELYLEVLVTTAFTDADSNSTLTVAMEGDSTESFTPDATETVVTIPAVAAIGDKFIARLNPGFAPLQLEFIRLKYTPNNGNLTTGAVSAYIVDSIDRAVHYADAVTIL